MLDFSNRRILLTRELLFKKKILHIDNTFYINNNYKYICYEEYILIPSFSLHKTLRRLYLHLFQFFHRFKFSKKWSIPKEFRQGYNFKQPTYINTDGLAIGASGFRITNHSPYAAELLYYDIFGRIILRKIC